MPLLRGPIKLQDPADLNLQADTYNFLDDATEAWGEIDAVTIDIDTTLPDLITAASDIEDPIPDIDIDGALASIADDPTVPLYTDLAPINTQLGISDNQFIAAVALAPGDSWSPPAPVFVPPDTTGEGGAPVPEQPPKPGPSEAAGAYLMAPPPGYAFTFQNSTVYGSSNFTVGDQYSIDIQGPAGAAVSADAWQNGNFLGTTPFGVTDGDGKFHVDGIMPPEAVGNWFEHWTLDSKLVMELEFNVAPSAES